MSAKVAEMKAKMAELKEKREEARQLNNAEVAEEDRKSKLPKNFEAKKARAEWEVEDARKRKEAEEAGLDYERVKAREMPAFEADRRAAKQKKKEARADQGFSTYADAQYRQYNKLTGALKTDLAAYNKSTAEWGDDAGTNSLLAYGQHDHVSAEGLNRMTADLDAQIEKRGKFKRRRAHYHEAEVDYINKRNQGFNKKLARFYGPATQEIRDNLERGTAI